MNHMKNALVKNVVTHELCRYEGISNISGQVRPTRGWRPRFMAQK